MTETQTRTKYTYDGDGKRVEKSNGKIYWYATNGTVLDETDATGSTANAAFSEYTYFEAHRVARRDYQSNAFYYFANRDLGLQPRKL